MGLFQQRRNTKMQGSSSLKGVTINGVALETYLGEVCDDATKQDVLRIVRESNSKKIHYHSPHIPCYKPPKERNGPVTTYSNVEIHQQNRDSYIKKTLQTNNIKGCIVAVLLSGEKPLTAFQIKERINAICPSDPVKAAQIRVYIGYILRSELGLQIEKNYKDGRARGAEYFLRNEAKMQHSLESACDAANTVEQAKKKVVDENLNSIKTQPKQDDIAFKYLNEESETPPKNEETVVIPPRIRLEGEVHFHFHFHIER